MVRSKAVKVSVSDSEKQLARLCKTQEEFQTKYLKQFAGVVGMYAMPRRAYNIWTRFHYVPNLVTPISEKPKKAFSDDSEMLVKIHHLVAESLQVQKEQLALFKQLARRSDNPLAKSELKK